MEPRDEILEEIRSPKTVRAIAGSKAWFSDLQKTLSVLLVLAIVVGLLLWAGYRIYMAKTTENWPTTQGTITEVSYEKVSHKEASQGGTRGEISYTVYIPILSYEYGVDGRKYTSDRVAYTDIVAGNLRDLNLFLRKYRRGMPITVYYSPRNSSKSVLVPGINWADFYVREVSGMVLWFLMIAVLIGIAAYHYKYHRPPVRSELPE